MNSEDKAALERLANTIDDWRDDPGMSLYDGHLTITDLRTALRLARSAEGLAGERENWRRFLTDIETLDREFERALENREHWAVAAGAFIEGFRTSYRNALVHYRGNGGKGKDGGDE